MLVQQVLHAMDAEAFALGAGKQHVTVTPLRLPQPGFHYGECGSGDGCAAFLTSFADYANVSAGSDDEVLACERGHLG